MRTPNCKCLVCEKPLYRRPFELAKVRHVACMAHRAQAQVLSGITDAQKSGLSLGREKGTNHRRGYKHKATSRLKASASQKQWCAAIPERVAARGEKTRSENHYRWKGGTARLNASIRRLTENRKWMDGVRARDGKCTKCGSLKNLEAHHIVELADLVERHGITNRDAARSCPDLWDLTNGKTLCRRCHYAHHNRKFNEDPREYVQAAA